MLHSNTHLAHWLPSDTSLLVRLEVLKDGVVYGVDHEPPKVFDWVHVAYLYVLMVCRYDILAVKKVFGLCASKVIGRVVFQEENGNYCHNKQENVDQQRLKVSVWVVDHFELFDFFWILTIVDSLMRVLIQKKSVIFFLGFLELLLLALQIIVFGLTQLFLREFSMNQASWLLSWIQNILVRIGSQQIQARVSQSQDLEVIRDTVSWVKGVRIQTHQVLVLVTEQLKLILWYTPEGTTLFQQLDECSLMTQHEFLLNEVDLLWLW